MATVIIPPKTTRLRQPVVFLAGPIQGAADWQSEAIKLLRDVPGIIVASPRRGIRRKGDFKVKLYNGQVDWEHVYLEKAFKRGVTLFWLAKEAVHDCERAYAQTTRFEFGEAVTLSRIAHAAGKRQGRIVVGIEEGYTGARYIRRTLGKKAPYIPILDTLEATCQAALDLLKL